MDVCFGPLRPYEIRKAALKLASKKERKWGCQSFQRSRPLTLPARGVSPLLGEWAPLLCHRLRDFLPDLGPMRKSGISGDIFGRSGESDFGSLGRTQPSPGRICENGPPVSVRSDRRKKRYIYKEGGSHFAKKATCATFPISYDSQLRQDRRSAAPAPVPPSNAWSGLLLGMIFSLVSTSLSSGLLG